MKKRLIFFFGFLVLGIWLFVHALMQAGLDNIGQALHNISIMQFGFFILLSLLNFGLYNLRWFFILEKIDGEKIFSGSHSRKRSFFRLFLHRMAGFAISYITPVAQTGGEPIRIMLVHEDGLSASKATSSVIIDKGLELTSLMAFIGIGILLAFLDGSLPPEARVFLGVVLALFVAIIFWFYYAAIKNLGFLSPILKFLRLHHLKAASKFIESVVQVEQEMMNFYHHHKKTFFGLMFISMIITGFLLLEHYLVALFLGVHMNLFQTFIVSSIPYIAYMIPIPGGLGLLENGHALAFQMLGISINAFVVVFIIRIRDLIFVLFGLIHASHRGVKMLKNALSEK